jgi:hypothetical protein
MIHRYTGIYIEYCLISATGHPFKYTPTSSVFATEDKISPLNRFIFCHYTVPFLNLSLIKGTREVKHENKED